jgi:hypothetical protein
LSASTLQTRKARDRSSSRSRHGPSLPVRNRLAEAIHPFAGLAAAKIDVAVVGVTAEAEAPAGQLLVETVLSLAHFVHHMHRCSWAFGLCYRPGGFGPTVALTSWGQALCPALDEMLKWAASREEFMDAASSES